MIKGEEGICFDPLEDDDEDADEVLEGEGEEIGDPLGLGVWFPEEELFPPETKRLMRDFFCSVF